MTFNKKAAVILHSKNPPWNLLEFCVEILLINFLQMMVCGIALVLPWQWITDKTIKTPRFYDNVHLLDLPVLIVSPIP